MDAMVALLDAGPSGLRSTPSPGDAHLSGEPSPVDAHTNPVSTRLSYGPPTAVETPASAPSHAAPMPGSPATAVGAAISTVGTVPMAHQADMVAAALALAAAATEKADLAGEHTAAPRRPASRGHRLCRARRRPGAAGCSSRPPTPAGSADCRRRTPGGARGHEAHHGTACFEQPACECGLQQVG